MHVVFTEVAKLWRGNSPSALMLMTRPKKPAPIANPSSTASRASVNAQLHRLRGEIVLAAGGSPTEAEVFFHEALDIARA